ncbi:hypothetical protein RB595_008835 [Gaeumannomyces hyphopodioides]
MHHLDPVNTAFAAAIANEPRPDVLGYVEARKALEEAQKHEPAEDIATETVEVPGEFGPTSVTIVRSKSLATEKLPMVYYLHGGGWILGSPAVFAVMLQDLARRTGAAIVFPYYTPAPEKQFPFQFEQTYEVLDYMVRHGSEHNLLVESIALAGDSVGGHMAIAMMNLSVERSLPAEIAHIILYYPVTDTHRRLKSWETYKDGPFLAAVTQEWMTDAFLPNKKDRETALASPLLFLSDEILSKFAPTTIFLASVDILLDEGLEFGRRLQNAGVDTAIFTAEGQTHAFAALGPLRNTPAGRAVMELTGLKLRSALFPSI